MKALGALSRARTDPRPGREDAGAPLRRLGCRRADDRERRRGEPGRAAGRIGLPEPSPGEAQPFARPQEPGRPRDLLPARRNGRRAVRELSASREAAFEDRLRPVARDQSPPGRREYLGLWSGWTVR